MSSYNRIEKVKYTQNPQDVIALQEYIVFEDRRAEEKYVVFRFYNNLNQRLLQLKFEVSQFNAMGDLVEKSIVLYNDCKAPANEAFVPNAKLKVNYACASLEVKLILAAFDRVLWDNGEFKDNSYRFDSYAEKIARPVVKVGTSAPAKVQKAIAKDQKKIKAGFRMRNIFRKNRAVFPAVLNVFLSLILIAGIVFSLLNFVQTNKKLYIDGYDILPSTSTTASICGYDGNEKDITIPDKLGDYVITKISSGAFKQSGISTVTFSNSGSLMIDGLAFEGCKSLTGVYALAGCGEVRVYGEGFKNCPALTTFTVETAVLYDGCFTGSTNISLLYFKKPANNKPTAIILDLFGNITEMSPIRVRIVEDQPDSYYTYIR